jgi:hypothetical protein
MGFPKPGTDGFRRYARDYYARNRERVKAGSAKWWRDHPDKRRDATRRYREAVNAVINEAKDKPCADCNYYFDRVCMDFDHRPGEVKAFTVSVARRGMPLHQVLAEIAKCDVVCANCHRIRSRDRGWTRAPRPNEPRPTPQLSIAGIQ